MLAADRLHDGHAERQHGTDDEETRGHAADHPRGQQTVQGPGTPVDRTSAFDTVFSERLLGLWQH